MNFSMQELRSLVSSEYLGSKSNITSASRKYFESIHIDDFESELPAVMNVWLKVTLWFFQLQKNFNIC